MSIGLVLERLPHEILLRILHSLDLQDLVQLSRTSHTFRTLSLDPYIQIARRRQAPKLISSFLPNRPQITSIQPPSANIYLLPNHHNAQLLYRSLVCIRLNRRLARRPPLTALVGKNILPRECCLRSRISPDGSTGYIIRTAWERGGLVLERKRKIEKEKLKDGLRVWLERKAGEIGRRRKSCGVGVGVLIWRFTRRICLGEKDEIHNDKSIKGKEETDCDRGEGKVEGLRRFWEQMSGSEKNLGNQEDINQEDI